MKGIISALIIFSLFVVAHYSSADEPLRPVMQNWHSGSVLCISFSPDGRYIASGSNDKIIKLWEATTGKLIRKIEGHADMILSINFSPDGRYISSGGWDKTVKVWEAQSG